MKNKILIGEMAKLHGISSQTLRYYDKIQLFQPEHIEKDNNYRYYDINQFAHLDCILFLKKLGMSLEEIEGYFKDRTLTSIMELLYQQQNKIEEEIKKLNYRYEAIKSRLRIIEEYRNNKEKFQCNIWELPKRTFAYINYDSIINEERIEYAIKDLMNLVEDELPLFRGIIGSTISTKLVNKGVYDFWNSMVLIFHENIEGQGVKILEQGQYATLAFNGTLEDGKIYYDKLLQYIKENKYQVVGDALVMIIADSAFSAKKEEYICDIQIPIK